MTIFIGDMLGRRRILIMGLTFWVIGEIIQTSSYSFPQFIVGRAVAGFGKHLPSKKTYSANAMKQAMASLPPPSPPIKRNA